MPAQVGDGLPKLRVPGSTRLVVVFLPPKAYLLGQRLLLRLRRSGWAARARGSRAIIIVDRIRPGAFRGRSVPLRLPHSRANPYDQGDRQDRGGHQQKRNPPGSRRTRVLAACSRSVHRSASHRREGTYEKTTGPYDHLSVSQTPANHATQTSPVDRVLPTVLKRPPRPAGAIHLVILGATAVPARVARPWRAGRMTGCDCALLKSCTSGCLSS